MRKKRPLDALFPKVRQSVLAMLFGQPEKAWYVSELARSLGVRPSSLQRELRDLAMVGILTISQQGRMVYYQANAESPIFADLRGLVQKTVGLKDVVADALAPIAPKIRVAFVYGSCAVALDQSDSDIDLMVVGALKSVELSAPLRQATERLNREINPTLYSLAEFRKKRVNSDHFLNRVLEKPKLFVIGNKDDLGKIAG